jgi:hypothetical protein
MKKILILATGWHFSSHFYEHMIKQIVPTGWKADYFCVAHRMPDDPNVISEKEHVRNASGDNFLDELDAIMYECPITKVQIEDLGWEFMLEDNTIGDMEVFNQWSDKYDYTDYDVVLITHDDNFILSDKLFEDVLKGNIEVYKPIVSSRYGNGHQFKTERVKLDDKWLFIDNGYTEKILKAFEPRGSFCFYKKELIDLLPNNKFDMDYDDDAVLTRVGKTDSVGYDAISSWNSCAGNFRDFLYDALPELELVNRTNWLSNTKRVSGYCIEGERGFIINRRADGERYVSDVQRILEELGWI